MTNTAFIMPMADIKKSYITIGEFADLYGVSRQTIWRLIKKHDIPTESLGNMRFIKRVEATRFFPRMVNTQIRMEKRENGKTQKH